jgi:4,5-dihydroxyphthalate decarboxylase
MTSNAPLTLALDLSDRTVALHLGLAQLPDDVHVEHVPQASEHRHERMLESLEWDLCEFSLATYIAAHANGWPARALAIFPRRIFAVSMLFVQRDGGISAPEQLVGRRIGIRSFHTTLCVWGLGDLAAVYGVPLAEVSWVTERADPFPIARSTPWKVEEIGPGDSLEAAFERGELDAILIPRVPAAVRRGTAVPLFEPPGDAMRDYFTCTGVFPIMHTIVMRDDVLERRPELPAQIRAAFEDAKRIGFSFYEDPNWCMLAEATDVLHSEQAWLGDDAYPYGIDENLATLQRLIGYERALGLIDGDLSPASLFVGS